MRLIFHRVESCCRLGLYFQADPMLLQRDVLFLKYCEDCFDVKGCGGSPSGTAICDGVLDGTEADDAWRTT